MSTRPKDRTADVVSAIAVCRDCPVRPECLAYALANGETGSVWGGEYLTYRHARRLRATRDRLTA